MKPIILNTTQGGRVMVQPEEVAKLEEQDRETLVVLEDYSVYMVEESLETIREMLGWAGEGEGD